MKYALSIATLAALSIMPAVAAEPLGRLFFSPAQRSVLDSGKHQRTQGSVASAPRTVHLNGVVTRSDADNTVWINGTAYYNASPVGMQIHTNPAEPASTAIRTTGQTAARRVKVGQRVDLNSGKVKEDFARRPALKNVETRANGAIPQTEKLQKSQTAPDTSPMRPAMEPAEKSTDAGRIDDPAPVR